MGCGDGPTPKVGTHQCPDLQEYYNQLHQTECHRHPHCPNPSKEYPTGWTSYHKFCHDCPVEQCKRCCHPTIPNHWPPGDFQCCSGQITGDERKGYCNAESCPFSTWCNQFMVENCPIRGNLDMWFSKGGNCGSYLQVAANTGGGAAQQAGATIMEKWIKNNLGTPFKKDYMTNDKWKKQVYIAKTYCPKYQGVCDETLRKFCSTVTREDAIKNRDLGDLCGCFMPAKQYPYSGFVSRGCAVTCNGQNNIKCGTFDKHGKKTDCTCDETVCIIDNVDINEVDSEGNVDLNQICGSTSGNSVCLLKDVDVNEINSRTGGGTRVNQQCKRCYKWVGSKEDEASLLSMPGTVESGEWTPPKGWVETPCTGSGGIPFSKDKKWILVGVILLVFLALLLMVLLFWIW